MSPFVGGTGPTIIALVHWFLDDDAAWCNGLRSPACTGKVGEAWYFNPRSSEATGKLFLCEALVASWPRSWRLGYPFTFAAVPAESMVRDWRSKVKGAQGEKGGRAELHNHVPGGRDVPDGSRLTGGTCFGMNGSRIVHVPILSIPEARTVCSF